MCQEMPTGLYTRWEYDSETDCFKARNNRTRNFENMVIKIDYFSIDFHFYDIVQDLFFGIRSVSYVNFSSTIMQSPLKVRYL